jgi:hypothetical protein
MFTQVGQMLQALRVERDEDGFVTAEHLGVAALAIAALVVIFGLIGTLGADVVTQIRTALGL